MLTGRRVLSIAAGLAVLVGLAAFWLARRPAPVTAALSPAAGESAPEREERALPEMTGAREVDERVAPVEAETSHEPSVAEATAPAPAPRASGTGRVEGYVFDLDGSPRPDCTVTLIEPEALAARGWYAAERRSGRSAEDGRYAIGDVPAGPWEVCLQPPLADVPEDQSCMRRVGSLVVVANAATTFDVVLPGARTLSGNVLLIEDPDEDEPGGLMLFLELAQADPPGAVVAHGLTFATPDEETSDRAFPRTAAELDRETREMLLDLVHGSERRLDELLADEQQLLELLRDSRPDLVRPEHRPPRGGNFRFTGLEAGRYVLRLGNGPRAQLVLEREVDLTLDDVALPEERIGLEEFLSTAIERPR